MICVKVPENPKGAVPLLLASLKFRLVTVIDNIQYTDNSITYAIVLFTYGP